MRILTLFMFAALLTFLACSQENSPLEPVDDSAFQADDSNLALNKSRGFHFGDAILVPHTKRNIRIDGIELDWALTPWHRIQKEYNLEPIPVPIENKYDLSSYFRMLWDDENLYFFARIYDDEINVSGAELYEKDGFEIYLDGDNSKNVAPGDPTTFPPPAYDSNDDFFRFIYGESSPLSAWGIIDPSNFEFKMRRAWRGYTLEVRMPFADLPGFQAERGHVFGLEFQVNDNDNGQRQNFLTWKSTINNGWFNPSLFGTAVLF